MDKLLADIAKNRIAPMLRDLAIRHGSNARAAKVWDVPLRTLASYLAGESDPKLSFLEVVAAKENLALADFFTDSAENRIAASPEMVSIPMRGVRAAAGPGAENGDEPVVGHMQFPEAMVRSWGCNPHTAEAVQSLGDSMFPTIDDGAWVIIDRSKRDLVEGKVFAFRTPDGLRLKRFQTMISGAPMLVSDNRDLYAPEVLTPGDLQQLRVAGRVFLPLKPI